MYWDLIETIRSQKNGIETIELTLTDYGYYLCKFLKERHQLAYGISHHSMQEAVEKCINHWHILTQPDERQSEMFEENERETTL